MRRLSLLPARHVAGRERPLPAVVPRKARLAARLAVVRPRLRSARAALPRRLDAPQRHAVRLRRRLADPLGQGLPGGLDADGHSRRRRNLRADAAATPLPTRRAGRPRRGVPTAAMQMDRVAGPAVLPSRFQDHAARRMLPARRGDRRARRMLPAGFPARRPSLVLPGRLIDRRNRRLLPAGRDARRPQAMLPGRLIDRRNRRLLPAGRDARRPQAMLPVRPSDRRKWRLLSPRRAARFGKELLPDQRRHRQARPLLPRRRACQSADWRMFAGDTDADFDAGLRPQRNRNLRSMLR